MLGGRIDDPYPHFVVDDIIDNEIINEINNNWPDISLFDDMFFDTEGRPHCYVFSFDKIDKLPEKQRCFWHDFLTEHYYPIVSDSFYTFSDEFSKKYGADLKQVIYSTLVLMEADESYGFECGMDVHNHYHHDPLMLFTTLLYVGGNETAGTTIYTWDEDLEPIDLDRAASICANLAPRPNINPKTGEALPVPGPPREAISDLFPEVVPVKTVDFVPNRFVSFIDGPLSFHGVDCIKSPKSRPSGNGRRLIRSHVSATPDLCDKIYGVSIEEFRKMARPQTDSPKVLSWYIKDINFRLERKTGNSFDSTEYTDKIFFTDYPTVTVEKNISTSENIVDAPSPLFAGVRMYLKTAVQRCFNALGWQIIRLETFRTLSDRAEGQAELSSDQED